MSKNKKQFGVWMDTHHATVVGRDKTDAGDFIILAHEASPVHEGNSNEKNENNAEKSSLHKLFKGITSHMQNVDELHVTGTGNIQEHFIHYLAETPQFKNTVATESTSNKMSDEKLIEYISKHFNHQ